MRNENNLFLIQEDKIKFLLNFKGQGFIMEAVDTSCH